MPLTVFLMMLTPSTSKQDVHIDSLARLLEAEHCGAATWPGKTKLGRAVHNSSALVAAFMRTTELCQLTGGDQCRDADGDELCMCFTVNVLVVKVLRIGRRRRAGSSAGIIKA
jgi:hypothetical protein